MKDKQHVFITLLNNDWYEQIRFWCEEIAICEEKRRSVKTSWLGDFVVNGPLVYYITLSTADEVKQLELNDKYSNRQIYFLNIQSLDSIKRTHYFEEGIVIEHCFTSKKHSYTLQLNKKIDIPV